jgi:alanine racemase
VQRADTELQLGSPHVDASYEPNRLEVDCGAIEDNARRLRRLVGPDCLLYAALKCNAYGVGLVQSTHALVAGGVDAISVARMQDAIELREAGIALPVLLYAGAVPSPAFIEAIERYDLTPTLLDLPAAELFSRTLTRERGVFLKVDVGQRRLGAEPRALRELALAVADRPQLRLDGIYTHLTVPADPVPAGHLERQFEVFQACLAQVEDAGLPVPVRMAASSGVLRHFDRMNLNAVDPGRLYFGVVPEGPVTARLQFRRVFGSLRTRLLQVKELDDDPRRPVPLVPVRPGMRIGIIALGTGDGLGQASAGTVLVGGRRAPLIEPISLEHCRIDLSGHPDAAAGDEVVVIGPQGGDEITLDEVAAHRGQTGTLYNIPINIRESVPRAYIR